MCRTSTIGSFLVRRPDSGKYAYHRQVPVHLRIQLIGIVTIPWKAKLVEIHGPVAIKISLGTGDLRTAQERRDQIHVQIEDLVTRALARLNANNRAKLAIQVSGLVAADFQRMSGQVRHDILADDDRGLIDRSWRSPLADVILDIRKSKGLTPSEPERAAQDVRARTARDYLATRDLSAFDTPIEEGALDADPDLIARLTDIPKQPDPRGMRLGDDNFAALLRRPDAVNTIPSPVEAILAENGIALPASHPDRRRLALDVLRAEVSAHRIVEARRAGDPTPTPERPAPIVLQPQSDSLSKMRDRWIQLYEPGQKAREDNKLYLAGC